ESIAEYRARLAAAGFVSIEVTDATDDCLGGFRANLARWPGAERRAGRMNLSRSFAAAVICKLLAAFFGWSCKTYLLVSARMPSWAQLLSARRRRHRQARQLKKPCRSSNSAPAAMTAINPSFLYVSGAVLSRISCPTYIPSTTGNSAAVETETASHLNWRLAVRRIASKPAETTR